MQIPTQIRILTGAEWAIVQQVYGSTLPLRHRIWITDGLGGGGAPFTIPTSMINTFAISGLIQAALAGLLMNYLGGRDGLVSRALNLTGVVGVNPSTFVNLGYLMNVGPAAYPNMAASEGTRRLLVHEMAHVWQGANSQLSTTYVFNSIMHQCNASVHGTSRNGAYAATAGQVWSTYNAEQQASLIEEWYLAGCREDHPNFPYIRDKVRQGIV